MLHVNINSSTKPCTCSLWHTIGKLTVILYNAVAYTAFYYIQFLKNLPQQIIHHLQTFLLHSSQKTLLLQKPEGEKIHFNKANQEKWRDSVPWGAKRIGEVRSACKRLVWKKFLDHKAHAPAGFSIYYCIWLFLYYLIISNFTMTLI